MNIKKVLAFAIILPLVLTGAARDNSPAAMSMLDYIVGGDYQSAVDMMTDETKESITAQALRDGWNAIVSQFGELLSREISESDGERVAISCVHEKGKTKFTCLFDENGRVKTFSIMPEAYGTAEPLPLELPVGVTEREIKLFEGTEKELQGLLTLPKDYTSDTPVVVMAQGSGPSDRDETIGPNKPFRDIAYGLAEAGIAVIRHDKMTYAHPEIFTNAQNTTIDIELVEPALEALRIVREEGFENAYLLGHSLGGMMAPYVMSLAEGGFKGGIIMAGSPRKFWEIMLDQYVAMLDETADEEQKKTALTQIEADVENARTICEMPREEAIAQDGAVMGLPAYYMWTVDSIDRGALAVENGLPLLILQGESDVQVSFDVDYAAWKELLGEDEKLFTFKAYPGLSHLFAPAQEGYGISHVSEAYQLPAYVDENVINDISDWIKGK